jgi:hypothetical protein
VVPEFIAAAIAAIGALKKMDTADNDQQNAINDAEQQMWDQRNAAIMAKRDQRRGLNPQDEAFARNLGSFQDQVDAMPVSMDWAPLVAAGGTLAGAIDKEAKTPRPAQPAAPTGEGGGGGLGGGTTSPVSYSEWQPVEHKPQVAGGNFFSEAAKRFEEEDEDLLRRNEWRR